MPLIAEGHSVHPEGIIGRGCTRYSEVGKAFSNKFEHIILSMMRRWKYHWTLLTVVVATLLVYTAIGNVWLVLRQNCPPQLPPVTSEIPTCEPCESVLPVPHSIEDPLARLDLRLGRWDNSRQYKLYDYAAVGELYSEISSTQRVCLATQTSIERLHELLELAAHWTGPISIAVFIAGDEFKLLRAFTNWLYLCKPEIYSRIAIHMAIPIVKPVINDSLPSWVNNCNVRPYTAGQKRAETTTWRTRNVYPQNHMRNLARKNCHTGHVFLVDVDIVPSIGMTEALEDFIASSPKCPTCAYVVPTYELDVRVANFPTNKSELVRLAKKKLAIPFHKRVFIHNQFASNFTRWEASGGNESSEVHISHNVTNFELLYEPFYVAPDTVPPHDERFLGYGYTRNTQVYEMFLAGFQFKVLSPVFTVHWGLQARRSRPLWREKQNQKNRKHFETFKRELYARYRRDPLHLLKKPPQKEKKT